MNEKKYNYCLELAKKFMANKEMPQYYYFSLYDDIYCENETMLNILSDEEVNEIEVLKEKFGDDYVNQAMSFLEDPDDCFEYTHNNNIVSIDTDNPCHLFSFKIHTIQENKLGTSTLKIVLNDDNYTKLIAYCLYDGKMTFNKLWQYDKVLYDNIVWSIYTKLENADTGELPDFTFFISLDEAQVDAEMILQDEKILNYLTNEYNWLNDF